MNRLALAVQLKDFAEATRTNCGIRVEIKQTRALTISRRCSLHTGESVRQGPGQGAYCRFTTQLPGRAKSTAVSYQAGYQLGFCNDPVPLQCLCRLSFIRVIVIQG